MRRACTPWYIDKPMRGHGLMQAIARVNRVFKDKPGGLVVDYLGLAHEIKRALAVYTESGGRGRTALDQSQAAAVMLEKYEICRGLFHGFDWSQWVEGAPRERLSLLPGRAGAHSGARERQRPLPAGGERTDPGIRPGRAARRRAAHPRRRGVFSGRPGRVGQAGAGRPASGRRIGSRRASNHLARGGVRGRHRHLLRRRPEKTRYFDPVRRLPGRGAGHAATQSRRRVVAKAAEGRACGPPAQERRPGALVRRDAGARHPPLSEPRRRSRASDRGTDPTRPRHCARRTPAASSWGCRRTRSRLRCAGDQ